MNDFLGKIYNWYTLNKRQLPWRNTSDPYKIWLSEIILQQTRVAQGTIYYIRFINFFPTIFQLANAKEDKILKLWQGLGYYSRARNLHFTARYIVEKFGGTFPADYNTILSLKGIGNYTAGAISSIAFDLPYPAVDGNIYRFLSRYFGIDIPIDSAKGRKEFLKLAQKLVPLKNAGFHNQALMEFGALQCTPKSPDCWNCPVSVNCFAYNNKLIKILPIKTKKTKQSKRYFYFYYINNKYFTYLEKRVAKDIWENLYQFPLLETKKELTEIELLKTIPEFASKGKINIKSISDQKKHILSHQIIYARLIEIEIRNLNNLRMMFSRVNKKDIYKFAVPRLVERFIKDLDIK